MMMTLTQVPDREFASFWANKKHLWMELEGELGIGTGIIFLSACGKVQLDPVGLMASLYFERNSA